MREPDYSILSKLNRPTSANPNRKSIVGQKFNRLTVFSLIGYAQTRQAMSYWLCRCDCGNFRIIAKGKLKNGSTKSCGCYNDEIRGQASITHGMNKSPTHRRWSDMLSRATNPNVTCAKNYIGRGITACAGLKKFENFYNLLGELPPKHEIDRINNEGSYSCGDCEECLSKNWPMNVRWVPRKINARNKRTTRWITINGETKSMAEWVEISGVKQPVAWKRLNRGWTPEESFDFVKRAG
jgi:hypothetical protein